MTRRWAYAAIVAACALPRLAVLAHERANVLLAMEKSDLIAQVFVRYGTFGFLPREPTAYTQPLYAWFLAAIYWVAGRHWWSFGTAQVVVAVVTALVVYEIGRRFLSPRLGLLAALVSTLQPYLVWHDVHGNREILDQLLAAAMFGLTLLVARTGSPWIAIADGAVCGVAILSNTRLVLLPFCLGAFVLWQRRRWLPAVLVPLAMGAVLLPWLVRNETTIGCFTVTTDARALWKANNADTYATLQKGLWIDNVRDIPQRRVRHVPNAWRTPQEAGVIYEEHHRRIVVNECAQTSYYEHLVWRFWEQHPVDKLKLMAQASWMLWNPQLGVDNGAETGGSGFLRSVAEPAFVSVLYLLALAGLAVVAVPFRALALVFLAYNTLAAWVFAGTTRYRVPFDLVLALLAAAAIGRAPALLRAWTERPSIRLSSQKR